KQVNSVQDIMRAHLQGTLDLSRLPVAERKTIARALAVNPEQRHASCSDMVAGLIEACRDQLDAPVDESFMGGPAPPGAEKKKTPQRTIKRGMNPPPPTRPIEPKVKTPRPPPPPAAPPHRLPSSGRPKPVTPAQTKAESGNFLTLSPDELPDLEAPMLIPEA